MSRTTSAHNRPRGRARFLAVPLWMVRPPFRMLIRSPSVAPRRDHGSRRTFFLTLSRRASSSSRACRGSADRARRTALHRQDSASVANARARPTRCCMPPESSPTWRSAHCESPTSSSFRRRFSCARHRLAASSSPKPTMSRTVRQGNTRTAGTPWRRACGECRSPRCRCRHVNTGFAVADRAHGRESPGSARRRPQQVDLPEPDSPMGTDRALLDPQARAGDADHDAEAGSLYRRGRRRRAPSRRRDRGAAGAAALLREQDVDSLEFDGCGHRDPCPFGR